GGGARGGPGSGAAPAVAACPPAEPVAIADARSRPTLHREEVRRELASIESALDALDTEIAAAAIATGPSRADALVASTARSDVVRTATLDNLHPDAPPQLRRLAHAYVTALRDKAELAREVGPRHPEMIEASRTLDWLRAAFDRQRSVELAEASAWHDELVKLPAAASRAR